MSELHPAVKDFLSKNGRIGGSSKSDAKKVSSRRNGKLGGRPKGSKNPDRVPGSLRWEGRKERAPGSAGLPGRLA